MNILNLVDWSVVSQSLIGLGVLFMIVLLWSIKWNDMVHLDAKVEKIDSKVESYHKEVVEMGGKIIEINARCAERHNKEDN